VFETRSAPVGTMGALLFSLLIVRFFEGLQNPMSDIKKYIAVDLGAQSGRVILIH
jgi:hypothetical protein